jgi:nucleolar complex protein 2
MGGQSRKATKKFEKNHLKDTIEKRNEGRKIKQRQLLKAKKKARNASDYGKVDDEGGAQQAPIKDERTKAVEALKEMTVDEFFQGGFELPELKKSKKVSKAKEAPGKTGKRKRPVDIWDDGNAGFETESEARSEANERDGAHKEDLEALAKKDPEFYKYLQENDAELLDFTEDAELAGIELSEDETPPKKKIKGKAVDQQSVFDKETELTLAMVVKWKSAMIEQHSLRAMREVVLAFRAAAHTNEDDGKEFKYSVSNPEAYHQLLTTALMHVPEVLAHHLPVKETASGKVRVPTESKKFRTLTPLLNSHVASVNHLLGNLSDAPTIKLTLASILPLLPYLLSFKKALKNLVKSIIDIWSDPSSTEATRINAFLLIRRLAVIADASLQEAVLKSTYQGLIKGSRNTTVHTLPGINLMKNSAAELWGLDPDIGYTTGFTYIRQLAIHLRTNITHPTKDSYKAIYNWQYTHSLDFWSRVLSTHCMTTTPSANRGTNPLHPLIYPTVQLTLGALRLIPTPTYFPLRFHLTRSLLRLSRSTHTYIPLAPSLLEVLQSPELKKPPRPSTAPPLDFATTLRAPKALLRTRPYQDGLGAQVAELLAEFFGVWAQSIAFPELVIPPRVMLKRWLKEVSGSGSRGSHGKAGGGGTRRSAERGNRNAKVNAAIALVVQKVDANARFVEERRRKVEFSPADRAGVEGFLKEVEWKDMPLGAFVVGLRRQREERERVLEEGRRGEEKKRGKSEEEGEEGGGKWSDGEMEVDEDEERDEDDEDDDGDDDDDEDDEEEEE